MRRVKIEGYVIYDENELGYGTNGSGVTSRIEDLLFNEDFSREWEFNAVSDEEVEWEDEE